MNSKSAIFCYAAADASLVKQIGEYLQTNLPYEPCYDEGLIQPGFSIVDAAARAMSGDLAVVVLSPHSVPPRWERQAWEPVFIEQAREFGANLVFLVAGACTFPGVLRKSGLIDFTEDRRAGLRALKRHLIKREQAVTAFDLPALGSGPLVDCEALRARAADVPAPVADVPREEALQFAHACREDFEGAFWIDATRRSVAGILGDTAHALGLRLSGSVEQNFEALRVFCESHRCLFVYDQLDPDMRDWVNFSGRDSVILTSPGEVRPLQPFRETQRRFSLWAKDPGPCFRLLGDACEHLKDAAQAHRLGPAVLALLKNEERLAEANEVLELLLQHGDRDADGFRQLQWDRSWILGHWGEPYRSRIPPAPASEAASQLGLGF